MIPIKAKVPDDYVDAFKDYLDRIILEVDAYDQIDNWVKTKLSKYTRLKLNLRTLLSIRPARMKTLAIRWHKKRHKLIYTFPQLTFKRKRKQQTCGIEIFRLIYEDKVEYVRTKHIGLYTICPYCNHNKVDMEIQSSSENDHFFRKTDFEILAFSFYNLVPVCPACNKNKGERKFSFNPKKEWHTARFDYRFKEIENDEIKIFPNVRDWNYYSQFVGLQLDQLCNAKGQKQIAKKIQSKTKDIYDTMFYNYLKKKDAVEIVVELKKLNFSYFEKSDDYENTDDLKLKKDILSAAENVYKPSDFDETLNKSGKRKKSS